MSMVFVTRFSRRPKGFVLLWAVVIRLLNCKRHLLSRGCVAEIVRRRDIPLSTVSDRDARLYLDAWRSFQLDLGTRVTITTVNGLHSDGQNSLRTCVLDFRGSWGNHLPVEASRMRSTCHVTNLMACFAESELRAKYLCLFSNLLMGLALQAQGADKAERSSVGAGSVMCTMGPYIPGKFSGVRHGLRPSLLKWESGRSGHVRLFVGWCEARTTSVTP
ncbi:hypothetical protein OSB04_023827 [Centaurea solstitialis]|uniref:Uncharacterized protein n=1 Tax=Centaurea solstitialis TaxID=347529 RepID=A0AA38SXC2_9ASTR|nr:hypothetical protein OSB04_023827 [Centaurea solstitialis]